MLDNDNIMTAKASEVVQKFPADEKDHHKCPLSLLWRYRLSQMLLVR